MRFLNVFLLVALAALAGACAARKTSDSSAAPSSLQGIRWKLVELDGKSVPETVNGKMPYLELSMEENRYSATGGCNGIGGEYKLSKNNGIKFTRGMSTMMACENMDVEKGLGGVFEQADRYQQDENGLTLNKGTKVLARFIKVDSPAAQSDDLSGDWELDYLFEPGISFDSLYANRKPTISFDVAEKKVAGNSSCNNFFGTFETQANKLKFGPLGSTKMACQGNGEKVFFGTLDKVATYSVRDNRLIMIMGDIVVMRWKRK
ncbi:META domain-containing protein [Sphingobacterium deserti]|uniref:DUF306 domain-containing protein n=1 Tax=Sphingobacterium deserti TaxID=1229276 RepID=A0A0B8T7X2_9SPHI|nr:META domain-containing protein [Sphingobacterium deserti]KGE13930.1 protein of unknown function DUF306 MetA and HslJ [Sphingobacterium deserti]